jgi:hypothetical protein
VSATKGVATLVLVLGGLAVQGGAKTFYEFGLNENAAQTSPGLEVSQVTEKTFIPTFGPRTTIGAFLREIKDKLPAAIKLQASAE